MSDLNVEIVKEDGDSIGVKKSQDISHILLQNKFERDNDLNKKRGDNVWGRKVASVPNIIIEKWLREWGVTWYQFMNDPEVKAKFMARLRSSDWRGLRTDDGEI